MIHGTETVSERVRETAGDAVRDIASEFRADPGVSVDLRDQNGDMLLIRIVEQRVKSAVIV